MPRGAQQQIELFSDLPRVSTKLRGGSGASVATGDREGPVEGSARGSGHCRVGLRFAARARSRPLVSAPRQRVRAFAAGRWLFAARGGGAQGVPGRSRSAAAGGQCRAYRRQSSTRIRFPQALSQEGLVDQRAAAEGARPEFGRPWRRWPAASRASPTDGPVRCDRSFPGGTLPLRLADPTPQPDHGPRPTSAAAPVRSRRGEKGRKTAYRCARHPRASNAAKKRRLGQRGKPRQASRRDACVRNCAGGARRCHWSISIFRSPSSSTPPR